jgi:hypothetical protein
LVSGFPAPGRPSEQANTQNPALATTWTEAMMHTEVAPNSRHATLTSRLVAVCRDPRNHCALVLAANAGLVACGAAEPFTLSLALHLMLLPFNGWRLAQALRAGPSSRRLPVATLKADVPALRLQAAAPRCPAFHASRTIQTIRLSPRPTR